MDKEQIAKAGTAAFADVLGKCGDFETTRKILNIALFEAQRCDAAWQKSQAATAAAVKAISPPGTFGKPKGLEID